MSNLQSPPTVTFNSQGLVTAVVQDVTSRAVLMIGYMNADALARTVETGEAWFWSRSRGALWHKGETSGNYLYVQELRADCDGDALLVLARPAGPTCHTGAVSCFDGPPVFATEQETPAAGDAALLRSPAASATPDVLTALFSVIQERRATRPEGSYTTYLFDKGVDKICKKIGEEATEVVIAAKNQAPDEITYEVADLFYHALVLLAETGTPPAAVWHELRRREGLPPRER